MICIYCKDTVPSGRAEFLIETNRSATCLSCSAEQRAVGYMDWQHKTAPNIVIVPSDDKQTVRLLDRMNRRAR